MFQVQIRLFDTPPGRTVPAALGGEPARLAEALAVDVTAG